MLQFTRPGRWLPFAGAMVRLLLISAIPVIAAITPKEEVSPETACEDFAAGGEGLWWSFEDCRNVWSQWVNTVPSGLHRGYPDRKLLSGVADEMRQRGTPCLVKTEATSDGAGSSTIRHMATWMYSKEIGCDWVTPDWGTMSVIGTGQNGTTWYCHNKKANEETLDSMTAEELHALRRCSLVSWLYYFHFDAPSIEFPANAIANTIKVRPMDTEALEETMEDVRDVGLANLPWDRLVLTFHPMVAGRYVLAIAGWDAFKRGIARDVLREMRQNFHTVPRPWYDHNPACEYDSTKLNFAIHVRLGDRRVTQDLSEEYYRLLDMFIDTLTTMVVKKGLDSPMFHIFTETLHPCPSMETGLFDELPTWPVVIDEVPACYNAATPVDCQEKQFGGECIPNRSGVFHVQNRPVVLHVGEDVINALSCMTHSDGVLMGCSAFGQISGLLTNGISMFSTSCAGERTPEQYKMIPPLAIAERGEKWVPIEGSWRDPRLISTRLFDVALDRHLQTKYQRQ